MEQPKDEVPEEIQTSFKLATQKKETIEEFVTLEQEQVRTEDRPVQEEAAQVGLFVKRFLYFRPVSHLILDLMKSNDFLKTERIEIIETSGTKGISFNLDQGAFASTSVWVRLTRAG